MAGLDRDGLEEGGRAAQLEDRRELLVLEERAAGVDDLDLDVAECRPEGVEPRLSTASRRPSTHTTARSWAFRSTTRASRRSAPERTITSRSRVVEPRQTHERHVDAQLAQRIESAIGLPAPVRPRTRLSQKRRPRSCSRYLRNDEITHDDDSLPRA